MSTVVRRGYTPNDENEFSEQAVARLLQAGCDLRYLLNRGYHIKGASAFVGNHYLLSERQRLAMVRAISSDDIGSCFVRVPFDKVHGRNHSGSGCTQRDIPFN